MLASSAKEWIKTIRGSPGLRAAGRRQGSRQKFGKRLDAFMSPLDCLDVRLHAGQRDVPGVVAIQPTGVPVVDFHPGVGAGDGLDARSARLTVRLVPLEGS